MPIPGKGDLAFGTHSALMPETLAERCIRLYSFADEIVLDPFTGSGTTLRVAKRLGRKFVGYELMESYKEIIEIKVAKNICTKVSRPTIREQVEAPVVSIDEKLLNKVFKSEAKNLLKKIPNGSIDLICVDPPYNMKKGDWDTFESEQEFLKFTFEWIKLADSKLKKGGSFYIFNT